MNFHKALQGVTYIVQNQGDITDIKNICLNSNKVKTSDTFIAIVGIKKDGHDYIEEAIKNGAKIIICNQNRSNIQIAKDVTVICVEDTRSILSIIINNYYDNPSKNFKLIGVTGTNGKTSVTTIVNYIFRRLGYKTGLIGTIDIYINDEIIDIERTNSTTPDCIDLGKIMDLCVKNNVDYVFMEVSSMALKMQRVQACEFNTAVFTNLSPEHLDDHKTMEDYKNSKLKLFPLAKNIVVNMDDNCAEEVIKMSNNNCIKFGLIKKSLCDLYADNIIFFNDRVEFKVWWQGKSTDIRIMIPSQFAIYNALAVIGICLSLGLTIEMIKDYIGEEIFIAGRYEVIKGNDKTVIIDFAHTPVALENLLKSVHQNKTYKNLISVFGCGGDRDPSKRSIMGRISQKYADYTVVTSDNPRTESPNKIINEIVKGMNNDLKNYCIEQDRAKAIKMAIEMANQGDVVVISGKGHETKQIFKDQTIEFSDKSIAKSYL